jgi:hypothetical protein
MYGDGLKNVTQNERESFKKSMNALRIQRNTTRMVTIDSGREDETLGYCHICFRRFRGEQAIFTCLDCGKNGKIKLCSQCEDSGSPAEHYEGKHTFMKTYAGFGKNFSTING